MFNYAELDHDNVVVGISQLSGEIDSDKMILINDLKVAIGSVYNRETSEFTAPEPQTIEPQPTIEEMQAQTLLNTEYLVSRSELGLGGN
ncbi:hypothetical protein ACIQXG_19245 [Lysinibacillus sphaericus]|uniref:hypothetical protein n=1 Tax=Lysinibacillus sphaericus TaxID=1421 RepID=UPI00380C366D